MGFSRQEYQNGLQFLPPGDLPDPGIEPASPALWGRFFIIEPPAIIYSYANCLGFPCGSAGKESTCNAGDLNLISGLGRSPGEGKGYPLQYSGLENSMDCIVHGVTKSQTRLSDFHFHYANSLYFPVCTESDTFSVIETNSDYPKGELLEDYIEGFTEQRLEDQAYETSKKQGASPENTLETILGPCCHQCSHTTTSQCAMLPPHTCTKGF